MGLDINFYYKEKKEKLDNKTNFTDVLYIRKPTMWTDWLEESYPSKYCFSGYGKNIMTKNEIKRSLVFIRNFLMGKSKVDNKQMIFNLIDTENFYELGKYIDLYNLFCGWLEIEEHYLKNKVLNKHRRDIVIEWCS